jgi:hypothetical protein
VICDSGFPNHLARGLPLWNISAANIMGTQPDFKELLELFNAHKVKYIIVGAYALAFYGVPRATGDFDILVKPGVENARRILSSLNDFGFGSLGLSPDDFRKKGQVIQLGVPPVRIDLLTSITGVSWERADKGKVKNVYGDIPVYYLGKKEFIANKRAIGRRKDAADIEALGL